MVWCRKSAERMDERVKAEMGLRAKEEGSACGGFRVQSLRRGT